jgi:DNA-directed RNA polymerase subunit F
MRNYIKKAGYSMATVDSEKLKKIDEKMSQLKAQRQAIVNREKEKDRKNRTRRLIQNGALAEKYLNGENLPPEEFEKLLQELVNIQGVSLLLKNQNNTSET